MTLLPQCVLALTLTASCAAPVFAQQPGADTSPNLIATNYSVESSSRSIMNAAPPAFRASSAQVAPMPEGPWFFRHYGIGTYESPLGFGGRIAVSLTHSLNLRAGASYFSFSLSRTESNIPFTADVRLQSEQAGVDWYPFHHHDFHLSPGVLFGNSNRVFGNASVSAGNSFTLNNVTYYSGAADPIQASGSVAFRRTAPSLTLGWGNWVRHPGKGHWAFPFEVGAAYVGDPKTALNYSGEVCTSAAQVNCQSIATDAPVQANVTVERNKLQNDANWARFYPIIAGGIVFRF
jgi:hypothetical protein